MFVIHYTVCALVLLLIILFFYIVKNNIPSTQNHIFLAMVLCSFFAGLMNLITVWTIENASGVPLALNYLFNTIYFLLYNLLPLLYYYYTLIIAKDVSGITVRDRIILQAYGVIIASVIISTPLTGWIFSFDEDMNYCHGPLFFLMTFAAACLLILSLIVSIQYRRALNGLQRMSVCLYILCVIFGVFLQGFLIPNILVSDVLVAFALLYMYLTLQNPDSFYDNQTQFYNEKAFLQIMERAVYNKKHMVIIGLELEEMKFLDETLGISIGSLAVQQVGAYLKKEFPKAQKFRLEGSSFVLSFPADHVTIAAVVDKLSSRFMRMWKVGELNITLKFHGYYMSYPTDVNNLEDLMNGIHYSLQESLKSGSHTFIHGAKSVIDNYKREGTVLKVLEEALATDRIDVYYQPIYSVKEKKIVSAEALVRLTDSELGFISPDEFIPLAERNGSIVAIGETIFEKVCCFVERTKVYEHGIRYLEVNLSVVQCIQPQLSDILIQKMNTHHVPKDFINFEITETVNFNSNEVVVQNMNELIRHGARFSLDDYGTGFSTMTYLITLPFDIIKIDKSIIWSAMEQEKARNLLSGLFQIIRSMQFKTVAEGVETREMAAMVSEMGCDYLQGFYFSKAIPEYEFMEYLENFNGLNE